MSDSWTQERALRVCYDLEPIISAMGMHVGLTGGCLYKDGPRKDMDIVLYRHHGAELATFDQFLTGLSEHGIVMQSIHHNVVKMFSTREGGSIDFLLRGGVSWPETDACPEGSSDTPTKTIDPDLARDQAIEQKRVDAMFVPIEDDCL